MAELKKNTSAEVYNGFRDSCLVARFGYYNLNAGTGNETPAIVKAWAVRPKNTEYPLVIFRDDNRQKIIYFSGIVLY